MEKRPFFRAAMAGSGKYHTDGFGLIGVYRVNATTIVFEYVLCPSQYSDCEGQHKP